MTVVDDIKNQLDLVDIVSQTVKLRKAGKNYSGFCPFHANTHTPAFVIFPGAVLGNATLAVIFLAM
jgi:DNA primase